MPTIRAIGPTDLIPLIAFLRNGSHLEVTSHGWPELQGDTSTRVMRDLFRRLVIRPGGHPQAWVCAAGSTIHGLAVAKPRAGKLAWDVRELLVSSDAHSVGVDLLEQLNAEAAKRGARRVFLSIGMDAAMTRLARQAGFVHYTSEALYAAKLPGSTASNSSRPARPRLRHDTPALFHLYNAAVPFKVRLSEAATIEEWTSLDRASRPWAPRLGGSTQHFVWDEQGELAGWLQINFGSRSQHMTMLVNPSQSQTTEEMLQYALSQLSHKVPIYVPVRDYQQELASALERAGFTRTAEYLVFVREMTARVPNRAFVPARA